MWMPPSGFWYQLLTRWQCHIRELAHILHLCPTVTLCCYSLQGTTDMRTILWVICLIFSPMGDLWVSHWWCLVVLCLIRLGFMNKSLLSTVYPQRTAYDLYDNLRGLHWLNNPIHWQNYFPGTLHSCQNLTRALWSPVPYLPNYILLHSFLFVWPCPQHVEVPRPGMEPEL